MRLVYQRDGRAPSRLEVEPLGLVAKAGNWYMVARSRHRIFFNLLAEDVIFDYVISVPGYPRRVAGRRAVAELYRGYGSNMVLRSADELAVHRDRGASVIVLEYAVHGQAVQTGRTYDNCFVSVITIKDRKVTHWRDYLDPVAVFNVLGWPAQ